MTDQERRRDLIRAYKERPVTGGVFAIENARTGRIFLGAETDLAGTRNKFQFSVFTKTTPFHELAADWTADGPEAFTFQVLDEMEQKPDQTPREFREELEALLDLWREKLGDRNLY